ncbi:MAG: hypothetical protein L3K13_06510 [Thermoplasmata archaeon]|nr:hypothetical protein [Thermoplasmata archaeon]
MRDAIENLEEGFGEATLHLFRLPAYSRWTPGPVVPMPSSELRAGELGWSRQLETREGPVRVEYHLLPGRAGTRAAARGGPAKLLVRRSIPGTPPGLLIGRAERAENLPAARRFLAALAKELSAPEED